MKTTSSCKHPIGARTNNFNFTSILRWVYKYVEEGLLCYRYSGYSYFSYTSWLYENLATFLCYDYFSNIICTGYYN